MTCQRVGFAHCEDETCSLKKECKSEKVKFQGIPRSVRIEEILEYADFEAIFMGKGVLIQPTPSNKPKSSVTIIEFVRPSFMVTRLVDPLTNVTSLQRSKEQLKEIFGDQLEMLKGFNWSRGGFPSFAKSYKLGQCNVDIKHLEVSYSKNGMKCALKFEVEEEGGGGCGGW